MGNVCDKIEDGLWLGDRGVYDKTCPEYTRFQTIITAMTEEEVQEYHVRKYAESRNWLWIPIEDDETVDISMHFQQVNESIEKARQKGDCVLLHCVAGISRSATLMAAYLIWKHHWSAQKALEYIRARRSMIHPNDAFMKQLKKYELAIIPNEHKHVQENIEEHRAKNGV